MIAKAGYRIFSIFSGLSWLGNLIFFHVYFPSFLFPYLSQEFLNLTLYFDCAIKYFISSYIYMKGFFFSFEMLNFLGNGRWRIVGSGSIVKFYSNLLDLSKIIMSVLKVKVTVMSSSLQSCPALCNLPYSSVHEILEARILEWATILFSRGYSPPRDLTWVSCFACRFFTI